MIHVVTQGDEALRPHAAPGMGLSDRDHIVGPFQEPR